MESLAITAVVLAPLFALIGYASQRPRTSAGAIVAVVGMLLYTQTDDLQPESRLAFVAGWYALIAFGFIFDATRKRSSP